MIGVMHPPYTPETLPDLTEIFAPEVYVTESGYALQYRIYVPQDEGENAPYPVVLFLHGAGSVATDNKRQLDGCLRDIMARCDGRMQKCIVIAPQCPLGSKWVNVKTWNNCSYSTEEIPESEELAAVMAVVEQVRATYPTDESRYYVTGNSMGGFATWDAITRHPDVFAAAVPICGGGDYRKAERIRHMPIWTSHGLLDPTVPPAGTIKMVQTLRELGAPHLRYTEFADRQHNIWTPVYTDPELYTWLFAQRRAK